LRRFRPAGELIRASNEHTLRIQFPLNGSRIDAGGGDGTKLSALPVKVAGGVFPMTMLVNGKAVGEIESRRQRMVEPPGPGFVRLTVMDAVGAADTVTIRIQ
jgi:penicillin-binding protein 1C